VIETVSHLKLLRLLLAKIAVQSVSQKLQHFPEISCTPSTSTVSFGQYIYWPNDTVDVDEPRRTAVRETVTMTT